MSLGSYTASKAMKVLLVLYLAAHAIADTADTCDESALLQQTASLTNLQKISVQQHKGAPDADRATRPYVTPDRATPRQTATMFFGAIAVLLVVSFIQMRRYIHMPDNVEQASTEKTQRLAKQNMSLALAMDIDDHRKDIQKENTMLALRAGCAAVAAALITFSPRLSDWFASMNYDISYTCVLVLWCMGRSLGATIRDLWDANVGTVMAFFWIWLLQGIMPNGYQYGDPIEKFYVGIVYFLLTTLFMMFGSWKNGVRVWCLSYHVGNMMAWLTPKAPGMDDGYSHFFQIKFSGAAFGYVIVTMLASAITVIALSLPNPRMAHRSALKEIRLISRQFESLLRCTSGMYLNTCADVTVSLRGAKIFQDRLVDSIGSLEAHIDASWWEHFDMGIFAGIRSGLNKHVVILKGLLDCTASLHDTLEYGGTSEKHDQFVADVAQPIRNLLQVTTDLFQNCLQCMNDGGVSEEEASALQKLVDKVEASVVSLSTSTRAAAKANAGEEWLAQQNVLKSDWEFLFLICSVSRLVADLGKTYIARNPSQKVSVMSSVRSFNVFSGFTDPAHRDFATRNSISLLLCWVVGYNGLFSLIPPHTAGIASNASLLMSTAVGSALKKNVGRVQGLVVGTTLGSLIYAGIIANGCDTSLYYITGFGTTFLFSSFVFYMFLSTTEYSFVFYLLGGFGSQRFLSKCLNEPGQEEMAAYFESILIAIVCVSILAMVDLAMTPSAGKESEAAAIGFAKTLTKAITFQMKDAEIPAGHSKQNIVAGLSTIREKASEAEMEPHIFTMPFNGALFKQIEARGSSLLIQLLTYRWALRHNATSTLAGAASELKKGDSRIFPLVDKCKNKGSMHDAFAHMLDSLEMTLESVVSAHSALDGFRANQDTDVGGEKVLSAIHDMRDEIGVHIDQEKFEMVALDKDLDVSMHVIFTVLEKYVKIIEELNKDCQTFI